MLHFYVKYLIEKAFEVICVCFCVICNSVGLSYFISSPWLNMTEEPCIKYNLYTVKGNRFQLIFELKMRPFKWPNLFWPSTFSTWWNESSPKMHFLRFSCFLYCVSSTLNLFFFALESNIFPIISTIRLVSELITLKRKLILALDCDTWTAHKINLIVVFGRAQICFSALKISGEGMRAPQWGWKGDISTIYRTYWYFDGLYLRKRLYRGGEIFRMKVQNKPCTIYF